MAPAPIGFDASRQNETFIRLAPPFEQYILTPPRHSDADAAISHMQDPVVYMAGSDGPPHPYTRKEWDSWIERSLKLTDAAQKELHAVLRSEKKYTSQVPVKSIQCVDPKTGEQSFAGDVSISRSRFNYVPDQKERERCKEENEKRMAGDPEIEWEVGYYVAQAWRGKGLMTAALRTILQSYVLPYLNAHKIVADFSIENLGSRNVLEKNGFMLVESDAFEVDMPEAKGGGKRKMGVVRWTRKATE